MQDSSKTRWVATFTAFLCLASFAAGPIQKELCARILRHLQTNGSLDIPHFHDTGPLDREYSADLWNLAWQAEWSSRSPSLPVQARDGSKLTIRLRSLEAIAAYPMFIEPGSIASFVAPNDLFSLLAASLQEAVFKFIRRGPDATWVVPTDLRLHTRNDVTFVTDREGAVLFGYRASAKPLHHLHIPLSSTRADSQFVEFIIPGGEYLWVFDETFGLETGNWLTVSLQEFPGGHLEVIGLWPYGSNTAAAERRNHLAIQNHRESLGQELLDIDGALAELTIPVAPTRRRLPALDSGVIGLPLLGGAVGLTVSPLGKILQSDPLVVGLPVAGLLAGGILGSFWRLYQRGLHYLRSRVAHRLDVQRYEYQRHETEALRRKLEARRSAVASMLRLGESSIRQQFRAPIATEAKSIASLASHFAPWRPRSLLLRDYLDTHRNSLTQWEHTLVIKLFRTLQAYGLVDAERAVIDLLLAYEVAPDPKKTMVTDAFGFLFRRYGYRSQFSQPRDRKGYSSW